MGPVQPDWPLVAPHRPFGPHRLATHWLAAVQDALLAPAQVLVVALQAAPAQTAVALEGVQTPLWRPSFGIVTPAASLFRQVKVLWLQYFPLAHSPST